MFEQFILKLLKGIHVSFNRLYMTSCVGFGGLVCSLAEVGRR